MSIGENSPCFRFIHDFLGTGGVGVEIGVGDGGNACAAVEYIQPTKYYLVDPWRLYEGYNPGKFTQAYFDKLYARVRQDFANAENVCILRLTSEEAATVVPDDLDFVYVDGNHAYDFKMLDMELWYPKIRSGGVLGGDDYNMASTQAVVRDFCGSRGLSFEVSEFTPPHPLEFWIIKP